MKTISSNRIAGFLLLITFPLFINSKANAQVDVPVNSGASGGAMNSEVPDFFTGVSVKYNIMDPASGIIGLYFQPEFSYNTSLELGVGVTRKNLVFAAAAAEEKDGVLSGSYLPSSLNSPYWTAPNQSDIEDFFYDYDNRKAKSGFFFSAMPVARLATIDPMRTRYFGFKFEYRRYKWSADALLPQSEFEYSGLSELEEKEVQLNYLLVYGNRFATGNFLLEAYVGLGFRNFTLQKRDNGVEYNGTPAITTYGAVVSEQKLSAAYFEVGLNIGFRILTP